MQTHLHSRDGEDTHLQKLFHASSTLTNARTGGRFQWPGSTLRFTMGLPVAATTSMSTSYLEKVPKSSNLYVDRLGSLLAQIRPVLLKRYVMQVQATILECKDHISNKTCELFNTWKWSVGICEMVRAEGMFWSPWTLSYQPPLKCPMKAVSIYHNPKSSPRSKLHFYLFFYLLDYTGCGLPKRAVLQIRAVQYYLWWTEHMT